MLIDTEQDAVIITDTVAGKWITACGSGSQHIPLGQLIKLLIQGSKRQGRKESLLLQEIAGA